MSDELRQLATAIKALAESNQGLGGLMREVVSQGGETNRVLGQISVQLADLNTEMSRSNDRHADSERDIRVIKEVIRKHGERLKGVEASLGLTGTE